MSPDRTVIRERVLGGDPDVATDFCRIWLHLVSRTFALNIKVLPADLETTVRLAYLLMRIADTIEDDRAMPAEERKRLLGLFVECFGPAEPDPDGIEEFLSSLPASWKTETHPDLFLVAHADLVFEVFARTSPPHRAAVEERVREMCGGMVHYAVQREEDGWFRLGTRQELMDYCYFVAGTVGLMLTELFSSKGMAPSRKERLRTNAVAFGLGLQLVNIARDIPADGTRRTVFVPEEMCRSQGISPDQLWEPDFREPAAKVLLDLIRLADREVRKAQTYVRDLPWTAWRVRLFCLWPLLIAQDTLILLASDPGAALDPARRVKIGRARVNRILWTTSVTCWSNFLLQVQFNRRNRALADKLQATSP
ncbi:MAG TPA: phytoene/squalene synthase family protein [Fibrobacteria bacterium]|nr:phytoene/squalene synthase family protein [Fibrobacteria bacterium]